MKLSEVVGQTKIRETLSIIVESVKKSGGVCPGILFEGFSGGGKSTLARAIASELSNQSHEVNCGCLKGNTESQLRFMSALEQLKRGDVLFLDEIHSLPRNLQEILYSAIEDGYITFSAGESWGGKIQIQQFTLIGATTHLSGLTVPMQSRFRYSFKISEYEPDEIAQILEKEANKERFQLDCLALAEYCRGNPRQAKNYLDWIKRYCETQQLEASSQNIELAMKQQGVHKLGLTEYDLRYLRVLKERKIAGVRALANTIGVEEGTVKKLIEPYLLKLDLIRIMPSMGGKRGINLDKLHELNL